MRKIYPLLLILLGLFNKGISQTLTPGTLPDFGQVCLGTTAGPNSFTLNGSSLTNENITIGPLSGYTFSITSGGAYSGTLTITQPGGTYSGTVYVKFTPVSAVSYNGNIPVAGGGATPTSVAVTGSGQANEAPSVSISASKTTICAGESVIFSATPTNGGTTPSYQWYVNNTAVGTNSATFQSTTINNSDVVNVVMTPDYACAAPSTATSNTITMTVNPIIAPSVTISTPSNSVCSGASTTFTAATPTNGGTNPTYQWQISTNGGGSFSDISTAINNTYTTSTLAQGNIIRLKLTSSALCVSPNPVTSNEITISINPDASISLTSAAGTNNQAKCINTAMTPITYTIAGGGTGATVTGLPAGVSSSFSGGVLTISGTPTVSGTFNYTVTTTGTCAQTSANGTITVNPDASLTLTTANNNQTLCENIAIGAIRFTVGATGNNASVTGLPTGVTGSYSGGVFTISGTPSVSGTFAYTVTATGTCGSATATGTLTVNPDATISLTSAAGTNNQAKCINTAITPITYTIAGGGTGATVTGLPAGVSSSFSGGVLTISGTPSVSGTFNYTVTTTGTCAQTSANGTITVNPDASLTLTSANNNQTLCENIAIGAIRFTVGATGNNASVTGLPSGVTGSYSGGVFTISGTPSVSGTFAYTVTATGTCGSATATGTLTVNPDATISLTSAAGTDNQAKCINTAITPITYTIAGGGTGATVIGLPAGVTSSFAGGILTISGSPTQSGTFNYTVTTTGTCAQASAKGTITVNPNAQITLTTGNNNQTICINTTVANIAYSITGGGTGATVTGLPSGVTGSYSNGSFVIRGVPTVSGTFNYTVTTSGTCGQVTAAGTLIVNPDATLVLSSSAATTSQNVCVSTAIASITYTITGTTNYTVTGLPAGVTASLSSGVITISGAPNNSIGSTTDYPYTIKTTGPCNNVTLSGHIKVWVGSPSSSSWTGFPITFTPSGSICPPASLQFSVPAATNVQYYKWTLPTGWTIISGDSTNNITVSVTTASSTGFQTVTVSGINPCGNISASTKNKDINVNSFTGVTVSPATQSVCAGGSVTVVGTLTGNAVSGTWSAPTGTFSNIITSATSPVTVTATYTPSISSGNVVLTITTNTPTGCSTVPGTAQVTVTVNQPSVAPTSESASTGTICNGTSTTLTQTGGSLGTGAVWKWYSNSSYTTLVGTSSSADGSLSVSPATTTTYYVRAESTTGAPCTANVAGAGSVTVTVNQPSVAPASLAASTATICSGSATTLTQTGGSLGTGASWKWYSDAAYTKLIGSGSGSNASLSVSPTTTTTYYLQIEGGTAPCSATLQGPAAGVTVTVNQPSVAPTSESASTGTICNGTSITLTQTGGSLGTGAVWKWYSNSSYTTLVGTSSSADGSLSVSPATTTTYYVRAESTTGAPCTANVAGAGSVTVTVNQPSVAPASLAASTATICSGSATTLTQTGGSLGTGASWKWYSDAAYTKPVGSGSGSNASLSVSPTTTTTYYLQIEGGTAPCSATLQGPAAGVTVTVNQPSVAPTSESASTGTICNGTSTTLTQTGGSLGTGAVWKWYSNSSYTTLVGTSSSADGSLSVSPATTTTYYVRAESTTGAPCTANVAGAGSVTVTVNQPVVINTQPQNFGTCASTPAQFSVVASGDGLTYQWYKGSIGSGVPVSNSSNISGATSNILKFTQVDLSDAGAYYVIVGGASPCSSVTSNQITLNVDKSISFNTQPQSQTVCINAASVVFTVAADANGDVLSYQWRKNGTAINNATGSSLTITNVSLSDAGDYDVVVSGPSGYTCSSAYSAKATLTVNNNSSITLSSASGTDAQIKCVNNAISNITYAIGGGGTGASITSGSLPAGVTGSYNAGVFTISGTPTVAGNFSYTITTSGPCNNATATGTITVNGNSTISLSSAAGTDGQTKCINTAITDITYAVGAGGTGASITAGSLPPGVTGVYNGGVFTISGTPNVSGSFPYTITTAGPCNNVSVSGTINVTANSTISLSSASGTDAQIKCINNAITNITYAIGGGGTGATITSGSLPAGVTGSYNAGVFTISGTPTVAGNFPYTITTSGPCTNSTASGKITVNDNSTITLSSAAATKNQTLCINTAVTNITYNIGGSGTGASVTGLPAGITGTYNSGVFTITGTPTAVGTFSYTVTTSGPCNNVTATGTIIVNDNSTISLTSAAGTNAQTACINTAITNITYGVAGGATGASVSGLPPGVTGSYNSGIFTITGTATTAGSYAYTVTTSGPCNNVSASGTITISPVSIGGTLSVSGASSPSNVKTLCPSPNSATINLAGATGIVVWQMSTDGGKTWVAAAGTASQTSLAVSNLSQTTLYRAAVTSGACTVAYSTSAVLEVIAPYPPSPISAVPPAICLGQSSVISVGTGYPPSGITADQGDFNNGASDDKIWTVYNNGQVDANALNAGGDNTVPTPWRETNGPVTVQSGQITYNSADKKFAETNGNFNTILESPVFSLIGITSTSFNFSQAYSLTSGASGKIEISTDGGATYTTLQTYTGPATYGTLSGGVTYVKPFSIDLSNYLGLSNLRIRFNYSGNSTSSWAVDNLSTPGANLPIGYTWTSDIPTLNRTDTTTVIATPTKVGVTTYSIQTTVGGCPGGTASVNVTVYPLPTITLGSNPSICQGTTVASLPYSATSASPTKYSIVFDSTAHAAGLRDSTNINFPGSSPVNFTVPAGIAAGTYNGTISVTNANKCGSTGQPFTITIKQAPAATVTGGTFCASGSTTLNISNVVGGPQQNITWSASPSGLNINSGTGLIDLVSSTAGTYTVAYNFTGSNGCTTYPVPSTTVTINPQSTVQSQPADRLVCPESASAMFTLSATGSPSYNWKVSADNGATWNPVSSTDPDYSGQGTSTLTVKNIMSGNTKDGYQYKTDLAINNLCPVTSTAAKLTIHNIWHGYTNTDWNTTSNWSDNAVPTLSCDSVIILNVPNKPILSGGAEGYTNHLVIRTGSTVKVVGNTLHIAGGIWDDNMALDATAGKIDLNGDKELNGTTPRVMQTIAGKMFYTPYLNNSGRIMDLQISSPNNASVAAISTLNDTLNITGTLSFGNVNNVTLNTGNNITLVSDANATARVADITNNSVNSGNNFNGTVDVERYVKIGAGTDQHAAAWEFLATPTTGQSVFQNWMENGTLASTGYGTTITSPFGTGFDASTIYPSMKYYKPGTNYDPTAPDWQGIMNTGSELYSKNGYMLFVRGDRSVLNPFAAAVPTRLRSKGNLLTYTQTVSTGTYSFTSVGNPYASAIDLRKIIQNNTDDFFTVWQSSLGGQYGYGGYITYTNINGNYEATSGQVNNNIQSGEAFFVQSTKGAGSLTFNETTKTTGSNNVVFRGSDNNASVQLLRANVYYVMSNGKNLYGDGTMIQFGESYNNKVDGMDGRKFFNTAVNLCIKNDNQSLVVERRKLPESLDTIFLSLTGTRPQKYQFVFVATGLAQTGLQAYLEDHYLNSLTPLNMQDTTVININIENTAGSKATNRFDIVFRKIIVLPPAFTTVAGHVIDHDIQVDWSVIHERNVERYDVETSSDGVMFTKALTVPAINSDIHNYNWMDKNLLPGYYYYRIRMIEKDGKIQYSNTVKVLIGNGKAAISIYPNPISDGVINLHFINQPAGKYAIRLMNQLGQVIVSKQIERMNGSNTEPIRWDYNLSHGIYQLEILFPDGSVKVIKVIY